METGVYYNVTTKRKKKMAKRNNNNGLKNLSLTDLVNMIGKENAQNIFTEEINKINKKIK